MRRVWTVVHEGAKKQKREEKNVKNSEVEKKERIMHIH